jgi:hypothetical protein
MASNHCGSFDVFPFLTLHNVHVIVGIHHCMVLSWQ